MATANINIRIDAEVKQAAERIYSELGLSMTTAINMFLRQSIRENGLPLSMKLPAPPDLIVHSTADIEQKLEEAEADIEAGGTLTKEEVINGLREKYGL